MPPNKGEGFWFPSDINPSPSHLKEFRRSPSVSSRFKTARLSAWRSLAGLAGQLFATDTGALKLEKRKQKVFHPEDTFERVILQCLERGTLQNLMFDNPQSITHSFMRGFVGGFLKLPPVKKALMSDTLRSSFLGMMKRGA